MSFDTREQSKYQGAPVECYRFAIGTTTYRWTSADEPVTLSTGVYAPMTISRGAFSQSQEDSGGAVTIMVPKSNPIVAPFMPYVPGSPMSVTIYRAHRGEESDARPLFVGTVSSVVVKDAEATLTCSPLGDALSRLTPSITYQPLCNWPLYGAGCQVNVASFRDTCTVSAVSGVTISSSGFSAHPSGWYRNGWMEDPNGEIRFIVDHTGGVITLMNPFPALAVDDVVKVVAGCDRTEATCTNKFNNYARHMGFPRLPTRNPFTGKIV